MPNFRRGAEAIQAAAESKGGGQFRPFVPQIQWRDDKEEKHILFLTPVDQIPTVDYHEWIPVGKGTKSDGEEYVKYEQFISRKDPAIGEGYDDLMDRLDVWPKSRSFAVAVELDPILESDGKRERVVGFNVKTDTYTRKTDDGEEEVTQPLIGLVIQSAQNFFNWLSAYDASQGPIEETPMTVTRSGKKTNTAYHFIPLDGRPVDLSALLENIDGVSYLKDEMEDLVALIANAGSDEEAALGVAEALMDKRLTELADKDRYEELVTPIEHIEQKFPSGGGKKKETAAKRPERPKRPSRRASTEEAEASAEPDPKAEAEEPSAPSRAQRFAALRDKIEAQQGS